jgi:hypothetical protein
VAENKSHVKYLGDDNFEEGLDPRLSNGFEELQRNKVRGHWVHKTPDLVADIKK